MSPELFVDQEARLIDAMTQAARGPQRNGLYALWLIMRTCGGLLPPDPLSERVHLQRVDYLERRLSSLSLPAPLRRAVPGCLRELRTPSSVTPALVLQHLVVPTQDAVGGSIAALLTTMARAAQKAAREMEASS